MTLKLELGKRYVLRDGKITGPLDSRNGYNYPFWAFVDGTEIRWTDEGRIYYGIQGCQGAASPMDIVSVYAEEKRMKIEIGKRYVMGDGRVTEPMQNNRSGQGDYPFRAQVPKLNEDPCTGGVLTWTARGRYSNEGRYHQKDLVCEFAEQPKPESSKPKIPAELESYILDKLDLQGVGSSPYSLGGRDSLLWLLSDVYGLEAVPAPKFKLQTITK